MIWGRLGQKWGKKFISLPAGEKNSTATCVGKIAQQVGQEKKNHQPVGQEKKTHQPVGQEKNEFSARGPPPLFING